MRTLFIQPIQENISLVILEDGISGEKYTIKKGSDFDQFGELLIEIIEKYTIDEVWALCGPGSFTRMRIITLTLSTLQKSLHIPIRGGHFFDIIRSEHPILQANASEYIIRNSIGRPEIKTKDEIVDGIYTGYGDKNDFTDGKILIEFQEDWKYVWDVFVQKPHQDILEPIYLKDPHITWSKKNTSLS